MVSLAIEPAQSFIAWTKRQDRHEADLSTNVDIGIVGAFLSLPQFTRRFGEEVAPGAGM